MLLSLQIQLRKFFKVYDGETSKIFLFGLLGAILQCGIAVGVSAADALFLNHLGASALPMVYLLSPVVIIAYIVSHTLLISRIGIERVLDLTLIVLALAVALISIFLNNSPLDAAGNSAVIYYVVKICTMVAYVALYTLYWNVADSYFTILDAKRLFAYLSAGCAIGAAAGGALVHFLSLIMRVEEMFIVWAALSLISLPVAQSIRRRCKKLEAEPSASENRPIISEISNLFRTYRRSTFALCITASLFLTLLVSLICEYQFYGILAEGRTDSELASLLGLLNCAVSVFNLVVNLFIFNRLVEMIGVRNLALMQSLAYIAVFCLLVVEHTEIAAIFGFFAYHGLFISIDGNNFNLLLNALPNRERKQLRTFIEGACEPLAHAFVGGGLVLAATALSPAQISVIGLTLAVSCFAAALFLRTGYVTAMIENLRSRWLDFSKPQNEEISISESPALTSGDITLLLLHAATCTPAERRYLERQITALGSRSVPGSVRALEEETLPLKSRSLAARVLSRVSFPQLESMANGLVDRTLKQAYETFIWEAELSKLTITDDQMLLALRMSRDRRESLIEFMLEILTLSGRLASFEPLAASLRSNDLKSKGTAIETVEQACSRELRQLLRPLLDERESDKRSALAQSLIGVKAPAPMERLEKLCTGLDDLEAALALELILKLDPIKAASLAEQRISSHNIGFSHKVAEEVLERQKGKEIISSFEKAAALLRHPATSDIGFGALLALSFSSLDEDDCAAAEHDCRILSINRHKFNLDNLIELSHKDSALGINLYNLIKNNNESKEIA